MAKKSYLDSINVPKPCDAPWDKIIGDDQKRFCLSCEKDVYNLSAMSRRKARKLVAKNTSKICVRYARLPNGKLFTTDQKLHQITRRTSTIAAGVIATTLTLSAATYAQGEANPKKKTSKEKEVAEQTQNKKLKAEYGVSQISFTVVDTQGFAIPNAKVKLTIEKTKQDFVVLTDGKGVSQFSSLPKANYKLEISSPYFRKLNYNLKITQPIEPNLKFSLDIASATGIFEIREQYEIPFFEAIAQENLESIQRLLSSEFDINTTNSKNLTALHVAVESENLKIVKLLIQNRANINAQDNQGRTPLMMMDEYETQTPILKYLVEKGANLNIQDKQGKTPLMYAVDDEIENLEAVKIFLKAGAKIETRDKKGNTALIIASDGFSEEIVEALLKAGANPNVKNKKGETPLSLAGSRKYITKVLRRYGAIK